MAENENRVSAVQEAPDSPQEPAALDTPPSEMPVYEPARPVRRVGTLTMGLALVVVGAALCVGLAILYIIRLFVFPKRFIQDFRSHGAGPGFLTVVAGICILGNQFVLLGKDPAMGEALFWIGSGLWIVILWGVFYFVFSDEPKPPLEKGINGAWLVATVSTQAIVILGCILIDHMPWDMNFIFLATTAAGIPALVN